MAFGTEGAQITQLPGTRNPADIYSNGINRGLDVAVKRGTPVKLPPGNWQVVHAFSGATAEGVGNSQASLNQGYGNRVVVKNLETGELISFAHLSQVNVKPGEMLEGGLVGYSGATGNVAGKTGYHLDIEYYDPSGKLGDITKTDYWGPSSPRASQNPSLSVMERIVRPAMAAEKDMSTTIVPTPQQAGLPSFLPGTAANQVQPLQGAAGGTQPIRLIKSGDSLSKIAQEYNTSWQEIARMNPQIKDPNKIYTGDLLYVPPARLMPTETKPTSSPFPPAPTSSATPSYGPFSPSSKTLTSPTKTGSPFPTPPKLPSLSKGPFGPLF